MIVISGSSAMESRREERKRGGGVSLMVAFATVLFLLEPLALASSSCEDTTDLFRVRTRGKKSGPYGNRDCEWLKRRDGRCEHKLENEEVGKIAADICPVTCYKCPSEDEDENVCEDTTQKFSILTASGDNGNFKLKNCKWIQQRETDTRCNYKLEEQEEGDDGKKLGKDQCPLTCKLCENIPPVCEDTTEKFSIRTASGDNGNFKLKDCKWIQQRETDTRCKYKLEEQEEGDDGKKLGEHQCPMTCKLCENSNNDNNNDNTMEEQSPGTPPPTNRCEDSVRSFRIRTQAGTRGKFKNLDCDWVSKKRGRCGFRLDSNDNQRGRHNCPVTCGICKVSTDSPSEVMSMVPSSMPSTSYEPTMSSMPSQIPSIYSVQPSLSSLPSINPSVSSVPTIYKKSIKVFILTGQSNMQGHGFVDRKDSNGNYRNGTLEWVVENYPEKYGKLRESKNPDGSSVWKEREDVWITYNREKKHIKNRPQINQYGNLLPIYAAHGTVSYEIGPELGIGWTIADDNDDLFKPQQQFLLLKVAWGGTSLYCDFRSPSSFTEDIDCDIDEIGDYYDALVKTIKYTLKAIPEKFPNDEVEYTIDLAGLFWHQGFNDRLKEKRAEAYESNLANFIRDIRTDLNAPDLPIAIGVTGMGGWKDLHKNTISVIDAQFAVSDPNKYPEFDGNVVTVETRDCKREEPPASPGNHGHHWMNNCESFLCVGENMAKGMINMLKEQQKQKKENIII